MAWCTRLAVVFVLAISLVHASMPSVRPPPAQRKMNSTFIDALIERIAGNMVDPDLATLFTNCFPNTLDTTVTPGWNHDDAFVITGDIDAMWLRDSTNQVLPYVPYCNDAPEIKSLIRGAVKRQQRSVLIDSYANAFNFNASGNGHTTDLRDPPMSPGVFEGKFEVDGLCAAIKLMYHYWNTTRDESVLVHDGGLFLAAAQRIMETLWNATLGTIETYVVRQSQLPYYRFFRVDPWEYDVYPKNTIVPTTHMARSAFRPSDDATMYDFLVPSNAMAVVELNHLFELCQVAADASADRAVAHQFRLIANYTNVLLVGIRDALRAYAVTTIKETNATILAYEVDGWGNVNLMDDPNIPGLLSLPFIGADFAASFAPDLRGWLLSSSNPYYYCGTVGCGMGSPHTPPGWIWPMALMVRALTSSNETEIMEQLDMLKASAQYTGWMHESFSPFDPKNYTRSWFAWANTLFGQTILDVGQRYPHLIYKKK
jgi:meiotically up-regulated gene 157 (Mug157) protein